MKLVLLLLLYTALALGFQRATPPLEASDEAAHLGYVVWLAQNGVLPVADPARPGLAAQEAAQPPLYYLVGASLVGGLDLRDASAFYRPMPGSTIGRADLPGPHFMFLPPDLPTGGQTLLAVRILRGLSILLGGLVVVLTWATARTLAPANEATAVMAAALVACNPMFLFIASSVNNDNLINALSAACILASCRPGLRLVRVRVAALAGASIGAAVLAKASGFVLLLPALYRVIASASNRRVALRASGILLVAVLAVVGWWIARNMALYGEPLPFTVQAQLAGNLRASWQPLALLREWEGFVKSFWGVFGGFNVIYPEAIYRVFFFLTALGVLSIGVLLARPGLGRDPRVRALALLALMNLGAVALWTSRLLGSQGRLLFPSLPAIAVLVALSVDAWPALARRVAHLLVPAFLCAAAMWACLVLIPGAYRLP